MIQIEVATIYIIFDAPPFISLVTLMRGFTVTASQVNFIEPGSFEHPPIIEANFLAINLINGSSYGQVAM